MADGLMNRYVRAGEKQPVLLYTDRDCCNSQGRPSKFHALFSKWEGLSVRLDIWHFMRRFVVGCTSESHPLYSVFMAGLSRAIFEWDESDSNLLYEAKKSELVNSSIKNPSEFAVRKAVTREEMARHCRRRTRGTEETTCYLEKLLQSLAKATDALGVPLFKDDIKDIWLEQRKHLSCIQHPPDIPLYIRTGWLTKGSVKLPVFRCARGSTSLESFHLHLNRFIPGENY